MYLPGLPPIGQLDRVMPQDAMLRGRVPDQGRLLRLLALLLRLEGVGLPPLLLLLRGALAVHRSYLRRQPGQAGGRELPGVPGLL